jgi:hypothetical protein
MFELAIVVVLSVLVLTLASGGLAAYLHAKHGHIPAVARVADAFATVALAGSSVILGPLRMLGSRDKQLDETAAKQLPPPDNQRLLSSGSSDDERPKAA